MNRGRGKRSQGMHCFLTIWGTFGHFRETDVTEEPTGVATSESEHGGGDHQWMGKSSTGKCRMF